MKYPKLRGGASLVNPPDVFGIESTAHLVPVKRARKAAPQEPITSTQGAERLLGGLARSPVERFVVVPLDQQNRPLGAVVASQGAVNETMVHPREVFAPAVEARASAVIVAHNHPSGSCTPSEADWGTTARLMRAGEVMGIPVLDHILVCANGATSMRNREMGAWSSISRDSANWAAGGFAKEKKMRYRTTGRSVKHKNPSTDQLRAQAERLLGWREGDSRGFSLPTLREWVRGKDPALAAEIADHISGGKHLFGAPIKRRRRQNPRRHVKRYNPFLRLGSHRARETVVRLLGRVPQSYWTFKKPFHLYEVTDAEVAIIKEHFRKIPGVSIAKAKRVGDHVEHAGERWGRTISYKNPGSPRRGRAKRVRYRRSRR